MTPDTIRAFPLRGHMCVGVQGITFVFVGTDADSVDYEDYH